jgi:hypothetical protein
MQWAVLKAQLADYACDDATLSLVSFGSQCCIGHLKGMSDQRHYGAVAMMPVPGSLSTVVTVSSKTSTHLERLTFHSMQLLNSGE